MKLIRRRSVFAREGRVDQNGVAGDIPSPCRVALSNNCRFTSLPSSFVARSVPWPLADSSTLADHAYVALRPRQALGRVQ